MERNFKFAILIMKKYFISKFYQRKQTTLDIKWRRKIFCSVWCLFLSSSYLFCPFKVSWDSAALASRWNFNWNLYLNWRLMWINKGVRRWDIFLYFSFTMKSHCAVCSFMCLLFEVVRCELRDLTFNFLYACKWEIIIVGKRWEFLS